jgi:hypothetical protein
MVLKIIGWESVGCMHLVKDRKQWQDLWRWQLNYGFPERQGTA